MFLTVEGGDQYKLFSMYMHICQVWRVQEVEKQTNQILEGDQRCEHHKTDIWGWEKKATVPTLSSHSSLHTRQNWLPVLVWPCHCPPLTLLVWPHQGDELTKQEYCLKTCFENYGKRTNNQLDYSSHINWDTSFKMCCSNTNKCERVFLLGTEWTIMQWQKECFESTEDLRTQNSRTKVEKSRYSGSV